MFFSFSSSGLSCLISFFYSHNLLTVIFCNHRVFHALLFSVMLFSVNVFFLSLRLSYITLFLFFLLFLTVLFHCYQDFKSFFYAFFTLLLYCHLLIFPFQYDWVDCFLFSHNFWTSLLNFHPRCYAWFLFFCIL